MKEKLYQLKHSLTFFSRNCLKIKTKDAKVSPFVFNESQEYLHKKCEELLSTTGMVRILLIKGRQFGGSTYVGARFYHKASTNRAVNTFILSHESGTTDKLFKMVKLFQENNPIAPNVRKSNSRELDFSDLNSTYYVGTAGSGEVGRGGTVHLFHGSEVSMWKNTDDIQTGLMESVPDLPKTEVILESTAKGMGNFFHRMTVDALAGKNEYTVVFVPWFWMDEYERDAQDFEPTEEELSYSNTYLTKYSEERRLRKLAWRRNKISNFGKEWKFKQEYPATIQEAFQTSDDTLIDAESITNARNRTKVLNNQAPLVLGVDPARNGDRCAICFRRGREIESIERWDNVGDDMHTVGRVAKYIERYNPAAVNIDCTNSYAIYDRLRELGHQCVYGIHFASRASEDRLYMNKRAEMWCNLRDWMAAEVKIPNDDEIHTDFMAVPDYKETSDGKIRLVSKEKIKEVFGKSPDLGDAAALTFATPISVHATGMTVKNASSGVGKARRNLRKR